MLSSVLCRRSAHHRDELAGRDAQIDACAWISSPSP
jgi:hypothetical protein